MTMALTKPFPLTLSDAQMDAVMRAAPLDPDRRSDFLRDVAALQGRELGDGLVGRVCSEMQRRYLVPPDLTGNSGQPKPLRKFSQRRRAPSAA